MGEVEVAEDVVQPPPALQGHAGALPSRASSSYAVDWQAGPLPDARAPSRRDLLIDGATLVAIEGPDDQGRHRVHLQFHGEDWTFRARIERGLEAVTPGRPARFLWTDRHSVRIVPSPGEVA